MHQIAYPRLLQVLRLAGQAHFDPSSAILVRWFALSPGEVR